MTRIENAYGDGIHYDTEAIQAALDRKGLVIFESGKTYLSSSLIIHSDTTLYFEPGSKLKASEDINTYIHPAEVDNDETRGVGTPVTRKPAFVFLYALGEKNITVEGDGEISGSCDAFLTNVTKYHRDAPIYPRPTMIYFENCRNLKFRGITLKDAPFWTLHAAGCDNVLVDGVTIDNPLDAANSDGIDPDHSRNVRIVNSSIACADDCIVLKNCNGNNEYHNTKDVTISNCHLISTSAALKIGTEGVDDFENVLVENCIIESSNRGISIQVRDKGNVRNVHFRNILIETRRFSHQWWGSAEPIAITTYNRDTNTDSGIIEDVTFENITATCENGIFIDAEESKIRNILLRNVKVHLVKKSKWATTGHDMRPKYNEPMYTEEKVGALSARNVSCLKLENFSYVIDAHENFAPENPVKLANTSIVTC